MKQIILFLFIITNLFSFGNNHKFNNQYVVISDLNVRNKNYPQSEVVYVLKKNDTISVDSLGYSWSKITYDKNSHGYVKSKFIKNLNADLNIKSSYKEQLILERNRNIFFISLFISFIFYLIGLYKSHKGTIVVINGLLDFLLLCVPLLLCVLIIILVGVFKMFEDKRELIKYIFLLISGLAIITSFIISVISNKKNIFNIIISIFSKIFVMLLMIIIILLFIMGSGSKKDGRFKDGTKNNGETKWKLFVVGIASFTIYKLIK